MTVPDFVRHDLDTLEIELAPEAFDRLDRFVALLLEANQRFNLTAVREHDEVWRRMIVDSLTAVPGMPEPGARVIDVGTGGGLPGVPLAVACPGLLFTLLESTGKKASFVDESARALGLEHVTVLQERAETVGQQPRYRQQFDVAVCRAVGPMNVILELCLPLVKVEGRMLAMKGPRVEEELREAGDALDKLGAGELALIDAYPEGFDNDLVIASIVKERPTPKAYPRVPGLPKKQPL